MAGDIDRGAIFERSFKVEPCEGGSFMLTMFSTDRGMFNRIWAFSHVGDLMAFLNDHAVRPAPNGAAAGAPAWFDRWRGVDAGAQPETTGVPTL